MQDLSFIAWCLEHLNYGTIFLLMTIESSFIPFPSEVVVPPAGYLARAGELSSWGVVLASSLGAVAGALINYYLALWLGRPLVYRFVNSRLGHALLLSEAKLIKAEQYFDKKGAVSTFIGRLLPGIRQLISIPAGVAKMPLPAFLFYTLLGAGIWNTILFLMGYFLPSMVPGIDTKEQLVEQVTKYSHEIGFTLLLLVALVLAILILKHYLKRRKVPNN
nr:DedA family protein [uncultured Porphyromonas sp.]